MNINIDNCYECFDSSMKQISDALEPLQEEHYDVRVALARTRLMYVTAKNVLDAYKDLKG